MSAYHVHDSEHYSAAEFNESFHALSLGKKLSKLCLNYAVTGLYFYDTQVCDIAADIKSPTCGGLKITGANKRYLEQDSLDVEIMGRDYAWLDTRTYDSSLKAVTLVAALQKHQGLMVACLGEITYRENWISLEQIEKLVIPLVKDGYGAYLRQIVAKHVV